MSPRILCMACGRMGESLNGRICDICQERNDEVRRDTARERQIERAMELDYADEHGGNEDE